MRRALDHGVLAASDQPHRHVAVAPDAGCPSASRMTNLNSPDLEDRGVDGFRVRRARLAQGAGAMRLGGSIWLVPPGQSACPYD